MCRNLPFETELLTNQNRIIMKANRIKDLRELTSKEQQALTAGAGSTACSCSCSCSCECSNFANKLTNSYGTRSGNNVGTRAVDTMS